MQNLIIGALLIGAGWFAWPTVEPLIFAKVSPEKVVPAETDAASVAPAMPTEKAETTASSSSKIKESATAPHPASATETAAAEDTKPVQPAPQSPTQSSSQSAVEATDSKPETVPVQGTEEKTAAAPEMPALAVGNDSIPDPAKAVEPPATLTESTNISVSAQQEPTANGTQETVAEAAPKIETASKSVDVDVIAKGTEAPEVAVKEEVKTKNQPVLQFKTETARARQKQAAALLAENSADLPAGTNVEKAAVPLAVTEAKPKSVQEDTPVSASETAASDATRIAVLPAQEKNVKTPEPIATPEKIAGPAPEVVKEAKLQATTPAAETPSAEEKPAAIGKSVPREVPTESAALTAPVKKAVAEKKSENDELAPRFDVVRVSRDGVTVMAGRAPSRSSVKILEQDKVLAVVEADRRGEWAVVLDQPMEAGQRHLGLQASLDNGRTIDGSSTIVIIVPPRGKTLNKGPELTAAVERLKEKAADGGTADETTAVAKPAAVAPDSEPLPLDTKVTETPQQAAPAGPATGALVVELPKDEPGARILQNRVAAVDQSKPEPPQPKVAIDTVDYDSAGNVDISGRSLPRVSLRAYLNNRLVGDILTNGEGQWRLTLGIPIPPGDYKLRVDQLDSLGKVVSRAEIPFTREKPATAIAALERQNAQIAAGNEAAVAPNVVVQPGNSLWRIARRAYGEGILYSVIYDANQEQIRDPDLIYPGQIFDLPVR